MDGNKGFTCFQRLMKEIQDPEEELLQGEGDYR